MATKGPHILTIVADHKAGILLPTGGGLLDGKSTSAASVLEGLEVKPHPCGQRSMTTGADVCQQEPRQATRTRSMTMGPMCTSWHVVGWVSMPLLSPTDFMSARACEDETVCGSRAAVA